MKRMLGRFLKKPLNSRGFTLAETLIAILILMMVSSIIAGALPAASNAFTKTVDAANAQVLLSTAITVLRDELSMATGVSYDSTSITYRSGSLGSLSEITKVTDGIMITTWYGYEKGDAESGKGRYLVSQKASTKDLRLSYDSITVTGGVITFKDLQVIKKDKDGEHVLAGPENLMIRDVALAGETIAATDAEEISG